MGNVSVLRLSRIFLRKPKIGVFANAPTSRHCASNYRFIMVAKSLSPLPDKFTMMLSVFG